MAAFASSTAAKFDKRPGKLVTYTLTANAADIKQGDIIIIIAAGTASALQAAASTATGNMFGGVAAHNASYSDGDRTIQCETEGIFYFNMASAAITDLLDIAYGETGADGSPQTITKTAPAHPVIIGPIMEIKSTTEVGVKLDVSGAEAA